MTMDLTTRPRLVVLLKVSLLIGLVLAAGVPSTAEEKKAPPKRVSVDLGGGVAMKLVWIPPGKFTMGTTKDEQDYIRKLHGNEAAERAAAEKLHEVEITRPFYMGVYEVTQAEYEKVMGKNPSTFSPKGGYKDRVAGQDTSRFPVEMVTWEDAKAFCDAMSKKFKKNFDLPTEAEWEYACRAGTRTAFCYGDALSPKGADVGGTYGVAEDAPVLSRSARVGSYKPNAFGLYDMHGNVSEWCKDWYAKDYYAKSPARDPQGPETGEGGKRVLRGGDWLNLPSDARSAARAGRPPAEYWHYIGFRVVVRMP